MTGSMAQYQPTSPIGQYSSQNSFYPTTTSQHSAQPIYSPYQSSLQYTGQSGIHPTTSQHNGQPIYSPYQPTAQYYGQSNLAGYARPQTSHPQSSSHTSSVGESGPISNPNSRTFGLLGGNRGGLLGGLLGGGGPFGGLLGNLLGLGNNRNQIPSVTPLPVPATVYGSYPGIYGSFPSGFGGYPVYSGITGFYG